MILSVIAGDVLVGDEKLYSSNIYVCQADEQSFQNLAIHDGQILQCASIISDKRC